MKKWGWTIIVLGFLSIAAGIAAKRMFHVRDYLLWFHIVGGLLIFGGGMMASSDNSTKKNG
jgi:hypothetical protein